jgi:hypothetical protein
MNAYKLTHSTELMQNYLQAEIMKPDAGFQALQTSSGEALLFSIGTDESLYVAKETPGKSTGWDRWNLSEAQAKADFGQQGGAVCKAFCVAQCMEHKTGGIRLAMVLRDKSGNDHLYLSLKNSDSDSSWVEKPVWTAIPYDDRDHSRAKLTIVQVFLSQSSDQEDYIVVDVIRDPSAAVPLIFRYYIDVEKNQKGWAWRSHDVPIDVEPGKYQSCLGRKAFLKQVPGRVQVEVESIDGIYTTGRVAGSPQFVYAPLYNEFDLDQAPSPTRLNLPGKLMPDAISACRNPDDSSDLYAISNDGLYYFASTNQTEQATAVQIARNDLFRGVRNLFAFLTGDHVMVWGLNGKNQIFYTTCPKDQLTKTPSAWSLPVPLLKGVEQVSPFVNRANSANTFFAQTGVGTLTMAVKSPTSSIWSERHVTLPPPSTTLPAQKFSSYTTRIQVTDANNSPPRPDDKVAVRITASNVVSVLINNVYYVLTPDVPVEVPTDPVGSVTVVERVNSLSGTRLELSIVDKTGNGNGAAYKINPMDKPLEKMSTELSSKDGLRNARITNSDGSTRQLLKPGASDGDLNRLVNDVKVLGNSYSSASAQPVSRSVAPLPPAPALAAAPAMAVSRGLDSNLVDPGDLFLCLANEVGAVWRELEEVAEGVQRFIVEIAGKVYQCLLETAEQIAAAAEWVFAKVVSAVEDLVKYLEYLFEWNDIKRTKEVMKNLTMRFLEAQVESIRVIKKEFDDKIDEASKAINNWAGIGNFSGLGSEGTATLGAKSTPTAGHSAPGSLLSNHFQTNAQSITQKSQPTLAALPLNLLDALWNALQKEADTLGEAFTRLKDLVENAPNMQLVDVLKGLVGILADAVLKSAKNVIDAVLDVIYTLAKAAVAALDTPIYFPVISDILREIGVPEFSLLDVVCYVGAVPATLVYKLATKKAPFPDSPETSFLINAKDLQSVVRAFSATPASVLRPPTTGGRVVFHPSTLDVVTSPDLWLPEEARQAFFSISHGAAGVVGIMSAIIDPIESMFPTNTNPFATPSIILAIVGGGLQTLGNILTPRLPLENMAVRGVNVGTAYTRLVFLVSFSDFGQRGGLSPKGSFKFGSATVNGNREMGAVIDAVLTLPAAFCTVWHFVELSKHPESPIRTAAILEETSNCMSYLNRIAHVVAVAAPAPAKPWGAGAMVLCSLAYSGLQIAEAAVG